MKFAFVAPRFHTNMYYRAISLQNKGNDVHVYVMYKGKSEYYENIKLTVLPLSKLSSNLINWVLKRRRDNQLKSYNEIILQSPGGALKRELKKFDPDVILLKEFKNLLALRTLLAAKLMNVDVIIFSQSQSPTIKGSRILFKFLMLIFKIFGVKAFVTPVYKTYNNFKNNGIDNIFYIPFVYPKQNERAYSPLNDEIVKILSIGKYVKRKDHILLIKAVENLLNKGRKVSLNIYGEVGDPTLFKYLKNYIKTKDLSSYIRLYSNIPYNEILAQYNVHDIFVLPSYNEPAAYSPVEAMAHGLPVICSSECGTNCYIEEGVNGYIFKAHEQGDLELKIDLICNNPKKLRSMSENAYRIAVEKHDIHHFADSIEKILCDKVI